MKKRDNFFGNLLKSMRIDRTLHIIAMMLIPIAFANFITKEVVILAAVCFLLYSSFSIHNAVKDHDFRLRNSARYFSILLIVVALILSFSSKVILFTAFIWIILGWYYNTISRRHLFLDIFILAITHFSLPVFSAGLLLGLDLKLNFVLTGMMFFIFGFITNVKNLVKIKEDRERGYKTIGTRFENPADLVKIFFEIGFILMLTLYFIFNLGNSFLVVLIGILILKIFVFLSLDLKKYKLGLKISRSIVVLLCFGFLIGLSSDFILLGAAFLLVSFIFWLPDIMNLIIKLEVQKVK